MAKDRIKNLFIVLLLGISIFSMFRYVVEVKERFRLKASLEQSQDQVVALIEEKQNLLQELGKEQEANARLTQRNDILRANLKAGKERIGKLFKEKNKAQEELEDVKNRFSILKAENKALISAHTRLYTENQQYKFRFSSVAELRRAIRELRFMKRKDLDHEITGNQGYLIKDGYSTIGKVKIEVVPAPQEVKN